MRLPDKFYRVVAVKANKTYTDKDHALAHLDSLRRRGVECYLYESEPVMWNNITPRDTSEDPTLPFD